MTILTYHKVVDVENFRRQLQFLQSSKFNVLTFAQFTEGFEKKSLKKKDVLITFDDGDRTVFKNGLPVLQEFGFPALLFVITELIGTNKPFWWDEIVHYTKDPGLVTKVKAMPNDRRLELLERLRKETRVPALTYPHLTVEELLIMQSANIAIANHSHTHPMFDKITPDEIQHEINTSCVFLRSNNFTYFNAFAYPNGNYTLESEAVLDRLQIKHAFLFDHKLTTSFENPLRISRLSVNDTTSIAKFKFILSGWHSRILPLRKKLFKLMS
jgi:poly-beta-1,6-N-acetyl-D-glucosamine N-deacetylase